MKLLVKTKFDVATKKFVFPFDDANSYRLWRQEWRDLYAQLSADLGEFKRQTRRMSSIGDQLFNGLVRGAPVQSFVEASKVSAIVSTNPMFVDAVTKQEEAYNGLEWVNQHLENVFVCTKNRGRTTYNQAKFFARFLLAMRISSKLEAGKQSKAFFDKKKLVDAAVANQRAIAATATPSVVSVSTVVKA